MKRKSTILTAALIGTFGLGWSNLAAQDFDNYFEDRTLRLDYIFAGNNKQQTLFVDELCSFPGWAGRRHHLNELPLEGNGQITVCDVQTGDTIYRHSFSSLFQEWQGTEEAVRTDKSFENTFLVPFPKNPVDITIHLTDNHRKRTSELTHRVDPKDILIHQLDQAAVPPHRYIRKAGDPKNCIDVVFVAEGYREDQMEQFYADCQVATDAILNHEPFTTLKDRFNFVAVASPSADSGVSVPHNGIWKRTAG